MNICSLFPPGSLPTRLGWDGRHQLRLAAAFTQDLAGGSIDASVDYWVLQVWRTYSDGLHDENCR